MPDEATRRATALIGALHAGGGLDCVAELEALLAAERPRLYATCLRLTGRAELAEEMAQEALLIAWRKLPEFRGESRLSTWLHGIARLCCANAARRKGEVLVEDGLLEPTDPAVQALGLLQREERERLIVEATANLSPLEQEAVYLRYVDGVPQDQITVILGLESASGARGLLQTCRRKLERALRDRLVELGQGSSFFRGTIR